MLKMESMMDNLKRKKYYIYFDAIYNKYVCNYHTRSRIAGIPYMSEQTAETICDYLNNGKYSLDMED